MGLFVANNKRHAYYWVHIYTWSDSELCKAKPRQGNEIYKMQM